MEFKKTTLAAIVLASAMGLNGYSGEIKGEHINSYHDQCLKVEEKRHKLTVNHNGKDLTFLYPVYGPDTYANVGKKIEKDGLSRPTMAETASLVHAVFNSDDGYNNEIKKLMKQGWLWTFTGILYVPNKGAFIQDNPEIRDGVPFMDKDDLEEKIKSGDSSVRYVKFGYKTGRMTPKELEKNEFVIGLAGKEGAKKLAEVACKNRENPYLWSFKSVNKPLTRVSAVGSDWDLGDRGLGVDGIDRGDVWRGFGFGVQKNTEEEK